MPLNETSSFTSYTKDGFDIDMQFKLREVCDELDSMGVKFMLSNSDTKLVNELYANYKLKSFASRQINANADGRGKITEVLVKIIKVSWEPDMKHCPTRIIPIAYILFNTKNHLATFSIKSTGYPVSKLKSISEISSQL